MPVDYTAKWEPLDGSPTFTFSSPYGIEYFGEDEKNGWKIPTADTPGDGEFSADGYAESKLVAIGGVLDGATADEFRNRWDALNASIQGGTLGRLYKSSDRFLLCRLQSLTRLAKDIGIETTQWQALFRASDPYYYSSTTTVTNLSTTTGSVGITLLGNYAPSPVINFTVSSLGTNGTITLAATIGGFTQTFVLTPSATGSYAIDCAAGTVIRAGTTDRIADFSGEFIDSILPGSTTWVTTLSGGLTLSLANIVYRAKYLSA